MVYIPSHDHNIYLSKFLLCTYLLIRSRMEDSSANLLRVHHNFPDSSLSIAMKEESTSPRWIHHAHMDAPYHNMHLLEGVRYILFRGNCQNPHTHIVDCQYNHCDIHIPFLDPRYKPCLCHKSKYNKVLVHLACHHY